MGSKRPRKRRQAVSRSWEYQLNIPMMRDAELVAAGTVAEVAANLDFEQKAIDQIRLAVIEACINAIEHSCSEDRTVYLRFESYEDRLEVYVRDNGQGFDPSCVEEPDIEAKLRPSCCYRRGWGLKLMRRLMDEVVYEPTECGTLLRMVKYRCPQPTSAVTTHSSKA